MAEPEMEDTVALETAMDLETALGMAAVLWSHLRFHILTELQQSIWQQ